MVVRVKGALYDLSCNMIGRLSTVQKGHEMTPLLIGHIIMPCCTWVFHLSVASTFLDF